MKIFVLFFLLTFPSFGQITFKEPKVQVKHEVLNLYLDIDNNSFISKQELKFTDFLKLDSERDDNWYSEIKGVYSKKPYEYSGYDLGHLTPSHITSYNNKDNHYSFSFYNQAPQLASFNRGKWARLERLVEDSISKYKSDVTIITGVIYDNNKKIYLNKSKIKIPISFYKILFIKTKKINYVWIGSNINSEVINISLKELNEILKLNKNDLIFNLKMKNKKENKEDSDNLKDKFTSIIGTITNNAPSGAIKDSSIVDMVKGLSEEDKLIKKKKMKLPIGKLYSIGKTESKEAMSSGGSGQYSQPLFTETKKEMEEKWSKKYKDSIDCNNPKGFSQRAHCQGKKKTETKEATSSSSVGAYDAPGFEDVKMKGNHPKGSGRTHKKPLIPGGKFISENTKKEMEDMTDDEIYNLRDSEYLKLIDVIESVNKLTQVKTMVNFWELFQKKFDGYISKKLKEKIENKIKEKQKELNRGKEEVEENVKNRKQIPGGKFVQVKEKCKKFPYCNQGDIKALKIFENEKLKEVISKISKEKQISESLIKKILISKINKTIYKK